MGLGDTSLDEAEPWELAPGGAAVVDAIVEFSRFNQSGAMPIRDGVINSNSSMRTPERRAVTQPMAAQGRRTRSPRSALRTMVAAGRPPTETQQTGQDAFVFPSTPLTRRAMPGLQSTALVAPPLPGERALPETQSSALVVPPLPGGALAVP